MDMETILRQFSFYTSAPAATQQRIIQTAELASLAPGAHYYHEGESCSRIAFLGAGSVRVYKIGSTGREITLYRVGPGESCILTLSCVLTGRNYPANAIVEPGNPVEAVIVPASAFRDWVNECREVRQFVFNLMSDRLIDLMMLVEEVAFGRMDSRIAAHLLAQQRAKNGHGGDFMSITHDRIADELGTAREVVSRILKDFERLGAVETARGRLKILNSKLLLSMAEGLREGY